MGGMTLNTTEHYQLNQWEGSDRIMREDFNADNRKTAEALTELAGAVAQKVDQAQVDATLKWVKIGESVLSGNSNTLSFTIPNAENYQLFLLIYNISGGQSIYFQWQGCSAKQYLGDVSSTITQGAGFLLGAAVPPGGVLVWYASFIKDGSSVQPYQESSLLAGAGCSGSVSVSLIDENHSSQAAFNKGSSLCVYGLRK